MATSPVNSTKSRSIGPVIRNNVRSRAGLIGDPVDGLLPIVRKHEAILDFASGVPKFRGQIGECVDRTVAVLHSRLIRWRLLG